MQGKYIRIEIQDANNDSRTVLYLLLKFEAHAAVTTSGCFDW